MITRPDAQRREEPGPEAGLFRYDAAMYVGWPAYLETRVP
jgi:hypothetical protein